MQASLGDNDNVRADALKGAEEARKAFQADGDKYMEVTWLARFNKRKNIRKNCGQDFLGRWGCEKTSKCVNYHVQYVWHVLCFFLRPELC